MQPIFAFRLVAFFLMSANSTEDEVIGGGAINEKRRNTQHEHRTSTSTLAPGSAHTEGTTDSTRSAFDRNKLSHSLHAMVGLDRYPNYLSRWNNSEDLDELEAALEQQLELVRAQKKNILTWRDDAYKIVQKANLLEEHMLRPPETWEELADLLDPLAARSILNKRFFRRYSDLLVDEVIGGCNKCRNIHLDPGPLEDWIDFIVFDVYSMPIFKKETCRKIKNVIARFTELAAEEENAMGKQYEARMRPRKRPVDLDTVGLGWINNLLLNLVMRPLSRHLYEEAECKGELDWRQGYVAGYSNVPSASAGLTRDHLVAHTDDSEVTLNMCVGDEFDGGELEFRGLRGTRDENELLGQYKHELGKALLHSGRHLHAVTRVTSGERYVLIVWGRSWQGIRSISCPCCWLNRRQDDTATCICGPIWN
mmetsp:Transcript_19965/g.29747  ORF Transcript_19965/g.29747 Transcript_19965/m.29747 type:complete len:423 (-) Transcript_19965:121-1389(-)